MAGILADVAQHTRLADHNRLELLLFRIDDGQRFGVDVCKVQEVVQCPPLTQVPESHPVVRGIAHIRGKTIPVLDLSMAIGGERVEANGSHYVVVAEFNRTTQGFLVHSVDRIVNMNRTRIMTPPPGIGNENYVTAVTDIDDELVEIIDVEKILSEVLADDLPPAHEVLSGEQWPWNQHVLVADDSVVARNQIIHVLDEMGVSHTVATNGREALDALKSWVEAGKNLDSWLALVLSDIDMPQMDGYALTAAIRSDQHLKNLHVVLHPSLNGVFNESMLDRVDANRFIARFRHDELQQLLKDRLNEHALQFDLA